jgi:methyl-accepting chemotaxis protein
MAEMPSGFFERTWSRAPLIARLTTAGAVATVVLAFAFGSGMAYIQEDGAQRTEEDRSRKEAQGVLRKLDHDFFVGESKDPEGQVRGEVNGRAWQAAIDSLRELLELDGLALVKKNGELFRASFTSKAGTEWDRNVVRSTGLQRLAAQSPDDALSVTELASTPEGLKGIETTMVNSERALSSDGNPLKDEDRKAVKTAQAAGIEYLVLIRDLGPVKRQVKTLGLLTVAEAFVASTVLLLVVLLVVSREVAGPVVKISKIVSDLARTGELASARSSLVQLGSSRTVDANDRNELRLLVRGFDALLASLERLGQQANAIARDDLYNDAFKLEGEMARGDLSVAFALMVKNLRGLSRRVNQIAKGDLSVGATEPGVREGNLNSAFRDMTEKLKLLLDELASAGAKIDKSARGLQESSRDQASTATQQAAAVTETMATMEELAASSGHIADTAKHVVQLADETLVSARAGQQAVTDVGTGMDEIVAASRQGAHRLLDLGEKSRSIGKVAELITGIAEQSKILALNAAIEAARAGDAGKGFGVVAEEVRNLADHVVESTREIEGLISQIQSEISAAVLASEEEVKRAEKGRELSTRATNSLQAITDTASKTTDAARQIELATNQQRSASGQVATAVREVASSSEEVATGAKRVTVSANELAALAHDLQAVINQFEVSDESKRVHSASGVRAVHRVSTPMPIPAPLSGAGERTGSLDSEALRRG